MPVSYTRNAIVDMGSNSVRLVIFETEYDDEQCGESRRSTCHRNTRIVYNKKSMAGLAGYIIDGKLDHEGIEKACTVLRKHLESAESLGVAPQNVHVFATAVLRNISNSREACKQIADATGVSIDLLSGEDEARLGFIGCSSAAMSPKGVVIDIGGGSTEISTWDSTPPAFAPTAGGVPAVKPLSTSLPFGSLYLFLNYVSDILPTRGEMIAIRDFTRRHLETIDVFPNPPYDAAVGIGGSARSSIKLVKALVDPQVTDVITLEHLYALLELPSLRYRETLHGILRICPDRVHTVLPGAIALLEILNRAGAKTLKISKSGLREGYLIDRVLGMPSVRRDTFVNSVKS